MKKKESNLLKFETKLYSLTHREMVEESKALESLARGGNFKAKDLELKLAYRQLSLHGERTDNAVHGILSFL